MSAKYALVTVGTTEFDGLISAVDSVNVLSALKSVGITKLLVQHGRGRYKIAHIAQEISSGVEVECALATEQIAAHKPLALSCSCRAVQTR